MTKGFITVATGDEHYYKLADNLVKSYRLFNNNLPFAIITEKENKYISSFDEVYITGDATHSYLDKFLLNQYMPYDLMIFIEADMLVYGEITDLFEIFEEADDFSCIGDTWPCDNKTNGWFITAKLPEHIKNEISYTVGLHGGILFMRKTQVVHDVFCTAIDIVNNYEQFSAAFTGSGFRSVPDEPVIALSMALNFCHSTRPEVPFLSYYPNDRKGFRYNIYNGVCKNKKNKDDDRRLLHWGTSYTYTPRYEIEEYLMESKNGGGYIIS